MTLAELRAIARTRLGDELAEAGSLLLGESLDVNCRCKDTELNGWIAAAQREACIRAGLLIDSTTAADLSDLPLCALDVVEGTAEYAVSPLILAIDRMKIAGYAPLARTSTTALDRESDTWETNEGRPERFVFDSSVSKIRFDRIPDDDYTVALIVRRLPLADPTADSHSPEIPAHYHERLLDWVEREAYNKAETDITDPAKSQAADARFTATFGERPSARDLEVRLRGPGVKPRGELL